MEFVPSHAFRGIRALYGNKGFSKLQNAHVLIIGVGGVGSWCTEALCRSGIGEITIIDSDKIEITNVNRQLHTTTNSCGKLKVDELGNRLLQINPVIKLHKKPTLITKENIKDVLSECPKHVCECIDDINAKAGICDFLNKNNITFITSGGAGGRINPSLLKIGDIAESSGDALISRLRNILRKDYGYPKGGKKMHITCTFSPEQPIYPPKEEYTYDDIPSFGASMAVTASAGLLMASWIIKQITEQE